jgi:voltage-gated potassium channel
MACTEAGGSAAYPVVREVVLFTASMMLVALVGLAVAGGTNILFLAIMLAAATATAFIRWLFPTGAFFSLTFANLIAVYTAVFAFFIEEVFGHIRLGASGVGFSLPVFSFVCGCWIWRTDIKIVVDHPSLRDSNALVRAMIWLIPVFSVGAGVLVLSFLSDGALNSELAFLGSMLLIAAIVLAVSRNVAIFLVDTALLFEEFFHRMSRLAIPAFAFLTFYSLLVIVFASIYCLVSQYSPGPHFRVGNAARVIGFSEAIHFSIVTISTVGYGDIVPTSNLARVLASLEVICGVMLLLFGVSALLEYTREHRHDRSPKDSEISQQPRDQKAPQSPSTST